MLNIYNTVNYINFMFKFGYNNNKQIEIMKTKTVNEEINNWTNFIEDILLSTADPDEVESLIDLIDTEKDFYIEIDGIEYRVIREDVIDDIATYEIKDIVQDCYLNGTDLDKYWWIEIDWEKTAQNCIEADGYGHHFNSYDGSEEYEDGWYFFRTN